MGDGRVLALCFSDRGMDSILVTENSRDWNPISVPAGFLPWSVDITGDRWLIQGWDSGTEDGRTQILFSDDQGAIWTEVVVDIGPVDGTAWVANAIVAGKLIVVVVQSDTWQPGIDPDTYDEVGYEPSVEHAYLFLSDGGPGRIGSQIPRLGLGWLWGV